MGGSLPSLQTPGGSPSPARTAVADHSSLEWGDMAGALLHPGGKEAALQGKRPQHLLPNRCSPQYATAIQRTRGDEKAPGRKMGERRLNCIPPRQMTGLEK